VTAPGQVDKGDEGRRGDHDLILRECTCDKRPVRAVQQMRWPELAAQFRAQRTLYVWRVADIGEGLVEPVVVDPRHGWKVIQRRGCGTSAPAAVRATIRLLSVRYRRPMAAKARSLPPDLQVWVEVRQRYRLSHAHVQMARDLGLNPRKFGKIGNHRQEPWKVPLAEFIEYCYAKRFGRQQPEVVVSVEERARQLAAKKAARKAARTVSAGRTAPTSADTTTA